MMMMMMMMMILSSSKVPPRRSTAILTLAILALASRSAPPSGRALGEPLPLSDAPEEALQMDFEEPKMENWSYQVPDFLRIFGHMLW